MSVQGQGTANHPQQLTPEGQMLLNPQIDQILQVGAESLLSPEQRAQDAHSVSGAEQAK